MAYGWPSKPNGIVTTNTDEFTAMLQNKTVSELQSLISDDAQVKELVKDLQDVKRLTEEKALVMKENRMLAEANLAQEPRLVEGRRELAALHEAFFEEQNKFKESRAKIESIGSRLSADTVLALLQASTLKAEDKSEELLTSFEAGNIDVDVFLTEYVAERKMCNERRLKSEKLSDQLNSGMHNSNSVHDNPSNNLPSYAETGARYTSGIPSRPAPLPPLPTAANMDFAGSFPIAGMGGQPSMVPSSYGFTSH